jgi:indole-3-glycerol phosphate synthase
VADLLGRLGRASARRAAAASGREPLAALRRRALDTPPAPALRLRPGGFDLFAEFKRRAPSAGRLTAGAGRGRDPSLVARRALAYARAGAAAVSVVTEPDEFAGHLDDLAAAARSIDVPVLRKDFLVDPYQVAEARAAGAGGVLLILRLLDTARLGEMLAACAEYHLFALLEAFDEADLARAGRAAGRAAALGVTALVGVNSRDLKTLAVDGDRLRRMRRRLPAGAVCVAESGIAAPAGARAAAALGYDAALVGTALMRAPRPGLLARRLIEAGRRGAEERCASG